MTDLETKKKSGSSLICIGPAGRGNIGDRAQYPSFTLLFSTIMAAFKRIAYIFKEQKRKRF